MKECLLTYQQVADLLAVSVSTAKRLARQRMIAPIRIGGSVRFDPSDIEALIKRLRCPAVHAEILIENAQSEGIPTALPSPILVGNGNGSGATQGGDDA